MRSLKPQHASEKPSRVTIIKIEKRTHPYVQIDTRALNDARLSWKAKGLHAYLLSKPPHWKVIFADLVHHGTDRAYSVRSALNELRRAGYAKLEPLKDEQGLFCGSCWTIYEWPAECAAWDSVSQRRLRFPESPENGNSGKPSLGQTELRRNGDSGKLRTSNNDSEEKKIDTQSDHEALRNSLANGARVLTKRPSSLLFSGPYQNHVKWRDFAEWCYSQGGQPHEAGFCKWLKGQKPQWRYRVRQPSEQNGYVLDGKFYTSEEAIQLAMEEPKLELATRCRRAVKRNGKIQIIEHP